jgi:hypothetical protein
VRKVTGKKNIIFKFSVRTLTNVLLYYFLLENGSLEKWVQGKPGGRELLVFLIFFREERLLTFFDFFREWLPKIVSGSIFIQEFGQNFEGKTSKFFILFVFYLNKTLTINVSFHFFCRLMAFWTPLGWNFKGIILSKFFFVFFYLMNVYSRSFSFFFVDFGTLRLSKRVNSKFRNVLLRNFIIVFYFSKNVSNVLIILFVGSGTQYFRNFNMVSFATKRCKTLNFL